MFSDVEVVFTLTDLVNYEILVSTLIEIQLKSI